MVLGWLLLHVYAYVCVYIHAQGCLFLFSALQSTKQVVFEGDSGVHYVYTTIQGLTIGMQ